MLEYARRRNGMKSLVRGTSALFFAATILFATTQPAAAAFTWYDWTGGYQLVSDGTNPPLKSGQDIRNAFYAEKDGYKYFRMELYGSPNKGAHGYANLYGFFIQKGEGNKYNDDPNFSTPLGFNVDTYLGAYVKPKLGGGGLKFTPDGGTFDGGTEYAFSQLKYQRNGYYLDWAIPEGDLPDSFTWLAATFKKGSWEVLNQTASVATPIPSAALLLGTGLIGLVGLRRRGVRKA
jgi:hypothetical protein